MTTKSKNAYERAVLAFKLQYLAKTMEAHDGHAQKAAAALGMHRNTFSRTLHEAGYNAVDLRRIVKGAKKPVQSARPAQVIDRQRNA